MFADSRGIDMIPEQNQSDDTRRQPTDVAEGLPPQDLSANDDRAPSGVPDIRKDDVSAMDVFLAWEKLRIVYNGVLVSIVVISILSGRDFNPFVLIEGALFANLCYCSGPVAEGYCCLFGISRQFARAVIFIVGVLMASVQTGNTDLGHPIFP